MKILMKFSTLIFLILFSCNASPDTDPMETWKQEIMEVEADFAAMALNEGIPGAFTHFAAAG